MKCLEKDPARRYPTARDLAEDLRRFAAGEALIARPPGPLGRGWRWARRHKAIAALSGALAASVLVGLAGVTWNWREAVDKGARLEKAEVGDSRDRLRREAAGLALDKGLALADRGEVGKGLHWMLRGLDLAPPEAEDLRRVARANLVAWSRMVSTPRLILRADRTRLQDVAYAPDGRTIFTGGDEGVVRRWDAETGSPAGPELKHEGRVGPLAAGRDGRSLLVGCQGRFRLWSPGDGEARAVPVEGLAGIGEIFRSRDGRTALVPIRDGESRVVDLGTGAGVPASRGGPALTATEAPDGTWITASGGPTSASGRPGADRGDSCPIPPPCSPRPSPRAAGSWSPPRRGP